MHMFKFSKMALDGRFQQFLHFVKKQRKRPVQKLLKMTYCRNRFFLVY